MKSCQGPSSSANPLPPPGREVVVEFDGHAAVERGEGEDAGVARLAVGPEEEALPEELDSVRPFLMYALGEARPVHQG